MALTDTAIRALKPRDRDYKIADEKGLYLLITPSGGRLWKLKFRTAVGVEKKLSLGSYPEIGLKDARDLRDRARSQLALGVDPAEKKRLDKQHARLNAANTFAAAAELFVAKNRRDGLADATLRKREWFLGLVDKTLGHLPIAEIRPIDVLDAVRPYEAAKNEEKAHRTLQFVGQVFRYAIVNQLAQTDPTRDLRGALTSPKPKHHAAILEPKKVGQLLRAIDGYEGQPVTRIALQLSALLFARPGELRHAEWNEIDFEQAVWRIPAFKMKGRLEHAVPLSRQSLALLKQARSLTDRSSYVFPAIGKSRTAMWRTPSTPRSAGLAMQVAK